MNELIKIETNENGVQLVSGRELHEKLEIKTRFSLWIEQYTKEDNKYGFMPDEDFTSVVTTTVVNNGAKRELQDFALTIEMGKQIGMMTGTDKGREIRKYFIECERIAKQKERVLTHKQELALVLFDGGSGAIAAHKELLEIETIELKEKHELELQLQRDGNNKILSGAYEVVNMLGIDGLTTTIFNNWMISRGLVEKVRFDGDKKDTLQPTELFFEWVAKKGYSMTTHPTDKGKVKMIYTTEFVNKILTCHMAALIEYVKINKN